MLAVCIIKCTVLDESADCQSLTMQPPVSVTPPSSLNLYFSRVEEVKKRGEEEESSGFGCFSHLKYIDKKKKPNQAGEANMGDNSRCLDITILSVVHHWNRGDSGGSASDYYTSDQASNPSHDRYCSGIHPALKCAPGSCDKEGEGGGARN